MMNLADSFRPVPAVVAREFEGDTVLVRTTGSVVDMQSLYVLNPVGTRIWTRLDGATTVQAILDELVATYEVDDQVARADVLDLMGQLLAAHLIEPCAPHSRLA